MTTLAEMAADLKDVSWQDARTFTSTCRKHGPPCRAKAHQAARNIYLSCDNEKTLTQDEFRVVAQGTVRGIASPSVSQEPFQASAESTQQAGSSPARPTNEDATAPASGERRAGAATTAKTSHSEEDSRVAPPKGGVKRGRADGSSRVLPEDSALDANPLLEIAPRRGSLAATANGNGKGQREHTLPMPASNLDQWQTKLLAIAWRLLRNDPAYADKAVPGRDFLEPLMQDMRTAAEVLKSYGERPPDDLAEPDLQEEYERAARIAIEDWLGSAIWSNPLPAVQAGTAVRLLELPDLSRKEIEPLRWSDMRQRRAAQQREWVVDGLLARGEMSSWAGKVEAGKTTLMRELTLCVVRGESFLGRPTQRGKVAYLMLDADGEEETYDEFDKLGFNDDDGENTLFIFEPMLAQMENGLEKLVKMLLDFGPTLAVIDPYPRLKKIEDFTGYENTYLMAQLSHVARLVRAHFALPGHIPRGRDDDADVATAGFGSISFSGGVNARFTVTNRKGTHTIRSSKGKGSSFKAFDAEYVTQQDEMTNRISLGAPWSWKDKARSYMEVVQQFLDSHEDRPFDVVTLAKEIRAQKSVLRTAANMLFGHQKIKREGDGLKSAPYIYASLAYQGKLTMEEVKRD